MCLYLIGHNPVSENSSAFMANTKHAAKKLELYLFKQFETLFLDVQTDFTSSNEVRVHATANAMAQTTSGISDYAGD
jgi:hypothetical protein